MSAIILTIARWLLMLLAIGAVIGLRRFRRKWPVLAFLAIYLVLVLLRVWWTVDNGLVQATESNNVTKVMMCLWLGCSPNSREWHVSSTRSGLTLVYGRIPLTAGRDPRVMRLLLDFGASPNAADGLGWTPLAFALRFDTPIGGHGDEQAVAILLDRGADPNNQGGEPPMLFAHDAGIVRLLLEHGAEVDSAVTTPLQQAAFDGNADIVALLLDRGAVVTTSYSKRCARWSPTIGIEADCEGWTALHFTAYGGHTAVAQLLLNHGANVNAPDATGKTPLRLARDFKRSDLERLLLSRGGKAAPIGQGQDPGPLP
jgi:hypothetical protein